MMSLYEFGTFHLDTERLLLFEGSEPVALGPKVVETLLALVEHPGEVCTKAALLNRIWPEGYVDEANLAQNVYVLRKTLRARLDREAIETIPRRGYRFILPVVRREAAAVPVPLPQPGFAPAQREPAYPRLKPWAAVVVLAAALMGAILGATLAPHQAAAGVALSTEGSRLYEIGRYYWNLRTPDGTRKSIGYFQQVIDSDPHDPRGYAALASADAIMGDYQYGPAPPRVYFARARAYAQKALTLDPNDGEAYAVLGMISSETMSPTGMQMRRAVSDLKRAIALDPSSGPAHEWYGVALFESGRIPEAYEQLQQAAELDPLSVATTAWLGNAAYLEGRYDDAITYARETLDLSPERHEAYETLGLAYEARGDRARAIGALRRLADECGGCRAEAAALLAEIYARSNRLAEARSEIAYAQAHVNQVSPEDLAVALAAVGDNRVAISLLRKSRGGYLRAELASDPRFAILRSLPQFASFDKPA
ncbi:MAG TPA: tetratricopeptide repeat protein [Candidatus Acidoferrales bacterium]|nr:tetratricopeptide repeat protein [Candidatus Acidoferrales bacterium]